MAPTRRDRFIEDHGRRVISSTTAPSTALAFALATRTEAEVRFDPGTRHLYATDASNYRHLPTGVVLPRSVDDLIEVVRVCHEHDAPITTRGAGTSLAGQATNTGVIIDCSRWLDRILDLDPDARTATVEPGVVLDDLRDRAEEHGLTFGPDPSTHDRCTLGGMIGNNACGVHSITAGRTVDNVIELDVLCHDGTRFTAGRRSLDEVRQLAARDDRVGEIHRGLLDLRDRYGDLVRQRFPSDLPRRVSGYNLDALLGDDHLDTAKALVGTEGTCVTVLSATVRLVPSPPERVVVALGYDDLTVAGDHVPRILEAGVIGLEGIDADVVAGARSRGSSAGLDLLPPGEGWLLAEFGGNDAHEARGRAETFTSTLLDEDDPRWAIVTDREDQQALWRVRSSGLGAVTFVPGKPAKWPGWEDAAVPPERTGEYLRDLGRLLDEHGYESAIYGHFGDGCVHTKISFDHTTPDGVATFRRFVERAADLVVSYGGSLSGEHGDGQSRAELYERMFGPELVTAFREFKTLFDPDGLMNPGRLVDPLPIDEALRMARRPGMWSPTTTFALLDDHGDLASAASRCVGVGACRRDTDHGTMCPSYRVTKDERHSTRGRARLVWEMLQPDSGLDGWRDETVAEALDLCLSCKACKSECPVDVDIATYKAEFNSHRWRGRVRPREHYSLGLIRWWSAIATRIPGLANAVLASRLGDGLKRLGGVTTERPAPAWPEETLTAWFRRRGGSTVVGPPVLLFPDTFTDRLAPEVGRAAVELLEHAGHRVVLPDSPVCCGRPLYDPGMLRTAQHQLRRLVEVLAPHVEEGTPIVGLEPSCVSALRDELPELLADDPRSRQVADATHTLAELLVEVDRWRPPQVSGRAVFHGHCHQEAVLSADADAILLDAMGLKWRDLDAGCCGLAGAFGFEAGPKHEVSVAVGERKLLPEVRAADAETLVITDGFSCRTQIEHLQTERRPQHLAQVLRDAVDGQLRPDAEAAERPSGLSPTDRRTLGAIAAATAAAGALVALTRRRRQR